jgi:large subunit ribosomal protein L9
MKVILREDISTLGEAGQTVEVKDGYGRNYLIPRHLAIPATKGNLRSIDDIKMQKGIRDKKRRGAAEKIKLGIEKLQLTAEVMVGEEERLFGSVTAADIAALMKKDGVLIDKRAIELEEPIKALGVYSIPVKVDKDVTATAKLWVIKKQS